MNVPINDFKEIPSTIINRSIRSMEPLILDSPKSDLKFAQDSYVDQFNPKSIFCLPIIYQNNMIGLIYLENNLTVGAFTKERSVVLSALASQIAISLENARHFEHTELLYRSTERFVPKQFLRLLEKEHLEDVRMGDSVKRKISALFADIRGFTTIAESLSPEQTTTFLNTYMYHMAPIIRKNNGFVNQFLGDGILALFPDSPSDALDAAVAMNEELFRFNQAIEEKGFSKVSVGTGINSGDAMICAIGEEERLDASVVSDAINTASRIENLNKLYQTKLLISEAVYDQLEHPEKYSIRMIDKVVLKGRSLGSRIYEVKSVSEDPEFEGYIRLYEKAFTFYERGEFKRAEESFKLCLGERGEDRAAQILLGRCIELQQKELPESWDGTITLTEK